jgi:GNAT superfamily N-acetyltransferase
MEIAVRQMRAGDGPALARIHEQMARYYVELAPSHFDMPVIDGLAEELDAELGGAPSPDIRLIAEIDGEVAGVLFARLLAPQAGAEREISRDLRERRMRIEYVATAEAYQRRGVATALVEAAESAARGRGATIVETWTYHGSPLSLPFWTDRMGYAERSVNLRKQLN